MEDKREERGLLKSQTPIRTFADWNEKMPGFIEIDLVDHSGGVEPVRQCPLNSVSDSPCFMANFVADVRKAVGYFRYETEKELEIINQIYKYLRLYTNYFQPQMKLIEKVRKKYDKAKTPYQRIMERSDINTEIKKKLKKLIVKLQTRLFKKVKNNPFYRERIKEKQKKIRECAGMDFFRQKT